jgi:uncharacterized membrane protein YbhN (UPF0104 family)
LVTVLALAYVAWKVYERWDDFPLMFAREWQWQAWLALGLSIVLMPLNYGLEAQKWRLMVRPFYPSLQLWTASKAILAGMAAGVFTPNRIGEYAGRILFLKEGKRVEAVVATFADRICQLAVTLLGGLLALLGVMIWMDADLLDQLFGNPLSKGIFIFLSIALTIFVAGLLIMPNALSQWLPAKWNRRAWIRKLRFALQNMDAALLMKVVGLSAIRYWTFSTQYVLLMIAFGYEGAWLPAYGMVAIIFLGKSVLPVMGLMELGVRESVALVVMTAFGLPETLAIASTFLLYLLNMLLPTLLGVAALQSLKVSD